MIDDAILNVSRFIADSYLALPALRREVKGAVASDAEIERRYREFRRLWQRTVVGGRVGERSTKARTLADFHAPLLAILGFDAPLRGREIDLDPERVSLSSFGDDGRVLVDPIPYGLAPDDRLPAGEFRGSAQRRMERALAAAGARFGLILGGTRWRIVQLDTANEPRYLEFDLDALAGDKIAEFGVFATMFSPSFLLGAEPALEALLEKSDALGTEVSEKLGPAARRALELLLEGVRADEANAAWVREVFAEGEPLQGIHREGIYVLYRLLFVLFGEAAVPPALPLDKPLYRNAYSLERLRLALSGNIDEYAENAYGIWESVKALFRLIDRGATTKEFHIPAYNGGLFGAERAPLLDRAALNDRAFVAALRELTTVTVGKGKNATRDRVSFRELGVAQLGAVFEGLLDYEPHIAATDLFEIAIGSGKQKGISYLPASAIEKREKMPEAPAKRAGEFYLQAWGGQRKSTGAYYTPKVIADYLVREALGPQAEGKSSTEMLEIAVCDPAMGSGGFLVSATEFLGNAYYEALVREGSCDPESDRADVDRIEAKRIVAERCIYGVDVNPMAVELAKVSLWLTTLSYDRPLSFFDHHLRCGNSLLGAPLRNEAGDLTAARIQFVPQAAFNNVDREAGKEEKARLKAVAARNAAQLRVIERGGGVGMFGLDLHAPLHEYAQARRELSADDPTQSAQDAVERIRAKERQLRDLTQNPAAPFSRLKEICDLWMAPWFWPYDADVDPPTTDDVQSLSDDIWQQRETTDARRRLQSEVAVAVARDVRSFHWELEFPEVFERGGFHAIVGNPPWETLSPESKEFFANYDPRFREYTKQDAIIASRRLRETTSVDRLYRRYARYSYQLASFLRTAEIYTWYSTGNLAKGDLDLFRSFVERDFRALRQTGRMSQVLKDGIYSNANCSEIRKQLMHGGSIVSLIANENKKNVFPITSLIRPTLLVAEKDTKLPEVRVAFFVGVDNRGTDRARSTAELAPVLARPHEYTLNVPRGFFPSLSPRTYAFLEITDAGDARILEALAKNGITFDSSHTVAFCREIDMTTDSSLFLTENDLVHEGARKVGERYISKQGDAWPLIEGDQIHQGRYAIRPPRYWIRASESSALPEIGGVPCNSFPRLVWRRIAFGNERTLISAIVPEKTFLGNSLQSIMGGTLSVHVIQELSALMNTFIMDWQTRIRGTFNVTNVVIDGLLIPSRIDELQILGSSRVETEVRSLSAFGLAFEHAEHMFGQFPLLDRAEPPLEGELRSTVTRDLVLARYAESLAHPKAGYYRERADRAVAMGARPFIPATRAELSEESEMLMND